MEPCVCTLSRPSLLVHCMHVWYFAANNLCARVRVLAAKKAVRKIHTRAYAGGQWYFFHRCTNNTNLATFTSCNSHCALLCFAFVVITGVVVGFTYLWLRACLLWPWVSFFTPHCSQIFTPLYPACLRRSGSAARRTRECTNAECRTTTATRSG